MIKAQSYNNQKDKIWSNYQPSAAKINLLLYLFVDISQDDYIAISHIQNFCQIENLKNHFYFPTNWMTGLQTFVGWRIDWTQNVLSGCQAKSTNFPVKQIYLQQKHKNIWFSHNSRVVIAGHTRSGLKSKKLTSMVIDVSFYHFWKYFYACSAWWGPVPVSPCSSSCSSNYPLAPQISRPIGANHEITRRFKMASSQIKKP